MASEGTSTGGMSVATRALPGEEGIKSPSLREVFFVVLVQKHLFRIGTEKGLNFLTFQLIQLKQNHEKT